jgi:hypothetical protein
LWHLLASRSRFPRQARTRRCSIRALRW